MTRTELLSLAERLGRYGDNDRDSAAAILRKLAELRPVAWRDRECWQDVYVLGKPTHTASEPLYQLSEALTDE